MSRRMLVLFLIMAGILGAGHPPVSQAQHLGTGPDGVDIAPPWVMAVPAPDAPGDVPEPGYFENQLLVKFKPGTSDAAKAELHARYGAQVISEIPQIGVQVLRLYDATAVGVSAYQANAEVQFAEPNYLVEIYGAPDAWQPTLTGLTALNLTPNDPLFAQQWHHARIGSPTAWDRSRGQGVTVAIVDTGVNCSHPDLAAKCVAGYDFVNSDNDPRDDHGHGTHVAGIAAAATNNGVGVAAVGFDAKIMPMKALGATGNGGHAAIAGAITWATDRGAQVINLSLGGPFTSSTLRNGVAYAISRGVTVVAAAGNDNTSNPTYPAAYDNVIGVSATTQSDGKASFSNYGNYVDVAAPGVAILSTVMSGSYQAWSGTSMASPVVAGLAGLVKAQDTARTPAQIAQVLTSTADDLGATGWDPIFGHGRINAQRALAVSGAPTHTPPPPTPTVSGSPVPATATPQLIGDCNQQLEDLLNRERNAAGLPPLVSNGPLRQAADGHAEDMAANRFCDHTGSDQSSPYDRMRRVNYPAPFGEIVACGQTSPQAAVQAWMNSAGHRGLILCSNCTELGGGCRITSTGFRYYWVVDFGSRPVGSAPTPTVQPAPTNTPTPSPSITPLPPTPTALPTNLPGSISVTLEPPNNRIGWVASNEPNTNHFDDTDTFTGVNNGLIYHGAMQFDLEPIPPGAYVNWARLEMTGRTRSFLGSSGTWTVQVLTSDNDYGFPTFGYSRVRAAYIESTLLPMLGVSELDAGLTNIFNFQASQRSLFATRLATTRRLTLRIDGPTSGSGLNLFTWDSGYGVLTTYPGPKLIVNYSLVPPTQVPTSTATDIPPPTPTATEGPPPTATETVPPPTPTDTAPPPPPTRTPTATEPPPLPTMENRPILEIRPYCEDIGWVRQGEVENHFGDDNTFTGFYQGLVYHGAAQFDLSGIPARSRIIAARLRLTGQSVRYLATAGNGLWTVKVLSPAADFGWRGFGYSQIHGARVLSNLVPTLRQADLEVGRSNSFELTADQLLLLEDRLASTRKLSLRFDGPSAGNSNIMDWDSGCGPGDRQGPVLQIVFGSIEPGEPTPTDLPESRQKGLEMIQAINDARRSAGLSALEMSEALMDASRIHNLDISSHDLFTHTGTDGSQPADRVARAGFQAERVGEVLAMGSSSVPAVLGVWLSRPDQAAQFLGPDLTHIGAHWAPAQRATIKNYWTVKTAKRAVP